MSDNNKPGSGKIIRTSSGSTRLTAGAGKSGNSTAVSPNAPAAPAAPSSGSSSASGSNRGGSERGTGPGRSGSGSKGGPGGGSNPDRPANGPGPVQSSAQQTVASPAPKAAPRPSRAPSEPYPTGSGPATAVLSDDPHTVRASSGGVRMGGKTMGESAPVGTGKKKKGPRTVRLTVSAIDPWSVMKMSFLMSVAIGVATVVAFIVLWVVLQATGVMGSMQDTLTELAGQESAERIVGIFGFGRVVAAGFIIAVINIVLMTALSTLAAFIYNIGSLIAGGFHLTLTDD